MTKEDKVEAIRELLEKYEKTAAMVREIYPKATDSYVRTWTNDIMTANIKNIINKKGGGE